MTQPAWPFSLVHPPSYVSGDVPTGPEFDLLQKQAAAGADGRIWTDIAAIKNWTYFNATSLGFSSFAAKSLCRDPQSRRWFAFGGQSAHAAFSLNGNNWYDTGTLAFGDLSPVMPAVGAAATNSAGVILAGGSYPVGSVATTGKLRESTDGGITWSTARNIGASNINPVNALTYSESLGLWFCSIGSTGSPDGLYSSADRATWTLRSTLIPSYFAKAEAPTPIIIGNALVVVGGSPNYARSVNGTIWTTETFPETISGNRATWSDALGKFFMSGATGIWSSATGTTGSWTKVYAGTEQASLGQFGRCLMRGDGKASVDGGITWFPVLELNEQTDFDVSATPYGVGLARGATKEIYLSMQIGY